MQRGGGFVPYEGDLVGNGEALWRNVYTVTWIQ